MSATWRAAVDWHATTLNPITSSIFSLIADAAGASGLVAGNATPVAMLAHQSRTDERTVRKALETLIEAGFIAKVKPGIYEIAASIMACPAGCPCPASRIAPGTTQQLPPAPLVAQAPPSPAPARSVGEAAVLSDLTISFERLWRDAYRTEPAPGLLRKLAISIGDQHSEPGSDGFFDAQRAFREYLRRVKDPMYLNLQKFASTWRVYLEPEKGRAADDNAADFAKTFGVIHDPTMPKDRAYLVPASAVAEYLDPKNEIKTLAEAFGKQSARIVNIKGGDIDL